MGLYLKIKPSPGVRRAEAAERGSSRPGMRGLNVSRESAGRRLRARQIAILKIDRAANEIVRRVAKFETREDLSARIEEEQRAQTSGVRSCTPSRCGAQSDNARGRGIKTNLIMPAEM